MDLVLASASARRRELLEAAGVRFRVAPADVDERQRPGEAPREYALRVARDKVHTARRAHPHAAVLGADTIVVIDSRILGKPANAQEAIDTLTRLSDRTHDVMTAVALAWPGGDRTLVESTQVRFRAIGHDEIAQYVATGEPMDKAGAYAIQGLASAFVAALSGSYSNVVGLPLDPVLRLLAEAGAG